MKNAKKLTYIQKQRLAKEGYDPAEYYCVKHALGKYWFVKKKEILDKKRKKINYLILSD